MTSDCLRPGCASVFFRRRWLGIGACLLLALTALGAAPANGPAEEASPFLWQVFSHLFDSRALLEILGRPQYTLAAFAILNLIVFVETGLLIGFCLPGDSLLVTAGLICATQANWNLPLLLGTLTLSAIAGDSVGYAIGYHSGPRLFHREDSWMFHKKHLLRAQRFYEAHGGLTIFLARFLPILRTFAPVVAGIGRMAYRRFLFFNVFGGLGWVFSMVLLGYYLPRVINPLLRASFGQDVDILDHVEKVILLVVALSISPGLVVWLQRKLRRPAAPASASPDLR